MIRPIMKTEKDFVAKRLAAHAAGTQDVARDPLVQAALADRRIAGEVVARWKTLRDEPVDFTATGVFRRGGHKYAE